MVRRCLRTTIWSLLILGVPAFSQAADLTGDWRGSHTCDCWNGLDLKKEVKAGQWVFIDQRPDVAPNLYAVQEGMAGYWTFPTVEGMKDPAEVRAVFFSCHNTSALPLGPGEVLQSAQATIKLGGNKDVMHVETFLSLTITDPLETWICSCEWQLERYSTLLDPTVVITPIPTCSELQSQP